MIVSKFSLLLGGALAAFSVPAAAQTAPDQNQPAEEAPAEDEILVTGTYTLPNRIDTATGATYRALTSPVAGL